MTCFLFYPIESEELFELFAYKIDPNLYSIQSVYNSKSA